MIRNTNPEPLFFPVKEENVYFKNRQEPISDFKAIVGILEDVESVFSIVSRDYKMITHVQAYNMGKEVHKLIFKDANACFEVFNVVAPKSKSYCYIDVVDKNYQLNIWKKEVYVPFIRIHNSYNKIRPLQFDIGFCRKLCDNGTIFEEKAVKLRFSHTKKEILKIDLTRIDIKHLKTLEEEFIKKIKTTNEIVLPRKYFVPVAAKTLNRNFNIHSDNKKTSLKETEKKEKFTTEINSWTDYYVKEFEETAYAFYNVITHYASNNNSVHVSAKNGLQRKCGIWLNSISAKVASPGFNWSNEIKGYEYLLN
jgi:hypothetical protein